MPNIYLSPSTQEYNPYINGSGSEEYNMNLIADYMEPYLRSSGIQYTRNTPSMTAASSIAQSNAGDYDLHLALHSNASPEFLKGQLQGTDVYYYPKSEKGREAADIISDNIKTIYPNPSLVKPVPTTAIGEVKKTKAPSVLLEVAYHDNMDDANWIVHNIHGIAINLVQSLTQFFGIPFIPKTPERYAVVTTQTGALNIREKPSIAAPILVQVPKGDELFVLGQWEDWYVVKYGDIIGYALTPYITVI